jgi:hypothetical protein
MYFFEVIHLVFKLFFAGVLIFIDPGTHKQLMVGILAVVLYMLVSGLMQPYVDFFDDLLWCICTGMLFLVLYTAQQIRADLTEEEGFTEKSLSAWLLAINAAPTIATGTLIIAGVYSWRKSKSGRYALSSVVPMRSTGQGGVGKDGRGKDSDMETKQGGPSKEAARAAALEAGVGEDEFEAQWLEEEEEQEERERRERKGLRRNLPGDIQRSNTFQRVIDGGENEKIAAKEHLETESSAAKAALMKKMATKRAEKKRNSGDETDSVTAYSNSARSRLAAAKQRAAAVATSQEAPETARTAMQASAAEGDAQPHRRRKHKHLGPPPDETQPADEILRGQGGDNADDLSIDDLEDTDLSRPTPAMALARGEGVGAGGDGEDGQAGGPGKKKEFEF